MAEMKISADGFTLNSTWTCRVVYTYDSDGNLSGSTCQQLNLATATNTVSFEVSLPSGAEFISAKVHADHTTGLYGGTFKINNTSPDDGFVDLGVVDLSTGYVDVPFSWAANTDDSTAHSGEAPAYDGSSPKIVVTPHESPSSITDVYLLIEYKQNGLIYLAVGEALVPYQIYHAENESLVPYQLFRAVNGELIQY